VGEHLKRARLDRGIQQRDAAREIGCDPGTLLNWEKGRVVPDVRFWPKILRFLGYDPRPEPEALVGGSGRGVKPRASPRKRLPAGSGLTPARSVPGSGRRSADPIPASAGSSSAGSPRQRGR
jgi:transcriptional regulator with XRE-family HTH domain